MSRARSSRRQRSKLNQRLALVLVLLVAVTLFVGYNKLFQALNRKHRRTRFWMTAQTPLTWSRRLCVPIWSASRISTPSWSPAWMIITAAATPTF